MRYVSGISQQQAFDSFVSSVLASPNLGAIFRINQDTVPSLEKMKEERQIDQNIQVVIFVSVAIVTLLLVISLIVFLIFRRRSKNPSINIPAQMKKTGAGGIDNNAISSEDLSDRSAPQWS